MRVDRTRLVSTIWSSLEMASCGPVSCALRSVRLRNRAKRLRNPLRSHFFSIAASADHSILLSTFSPVSSVLKTPPTPSLRIPFPTPLKSVLPLPLAFPSLNLAYILVGSSDEKLRIIDYSELRSPPPGEFRGLPSEKESEGLQLAIEGHSHEVIELKGYTVVNEEGRKEAWVVSASVDGTLRRWNWDRLKKGEYEVKGIVVEEEEEEQKEGLLTEEEERELEELMADD